MNRKIFFTMEDVAQTFAIQLASAHVLKDLARQQIK